MPSDYLGTVREFLEALRIESLSQNPGIPAQQSRSAIPLARPATYSPNVDRLPLYKHFAFQLDDVCIIYYLSYSLFFSILQINTLKIVFTGILFLPSIHVHLI